MNACIHSIVHSDNLNIYPTAGSMKVLKYIQAAIYSNFRIPPEVRKYTHFSYDYSFIVIFTSDFKTHISIIITHPPIARAILSTCNLTHS